MIVLLSLLALVALGFIWWWVVNPHHEKSRHQSREVQLPLYTTRSRRRGVNIAAPSFAGSAAPVAMAAATAAASPAEAAGPAGGAAPDDAPSVGSRRTGNGATVERVFNTVPWVEPEAVRSGPPPAAGTSGNGSSNGHGATAELSAGVAPASRPLGPASSRSHAAPPRGAAPVAPAEVDLERWAPRPERDPAATVQFLPGRLEVLQGRTMEGQEIRFVRPERAGERAVVTFGRGEGAPYRHVQLKVATVSRLHARMSLEPGSDRWTLENLSSTNPVAVNGADLAQGAAPRTLSDGDRVEMGEIVFVFRAR